MQNRRDYTASQFVDVSFTGNDEPANIYALLRQWMSGPRKKMATKIISGSYDDTIKIWDLNTYTCIKTIRGHLNDVTTVLRLKDGKIASGSRDDSLKIWDPETGECLGTYTGHESSVYPVIELPDGRIVTGGYDKRLMFWDRKRQHRDDEYFGHHNARINCILLLNDGVTMVTGDDTGVLIFWDIAKNNKEPIKVLRRPRETKDVIQLSDGTIVTANKHIWLWREGTENGVEVKTTSRPNTFCDLKDGRVISGHANGNMQVWGETFVDYYELAANHIDGVNSIVHLGGDMIACAGFDRITIWNIKTREMIKDIIDRTNERVIRIFGIALFE
jgi:WD40 repeat protein